MAKSRMINQMSDQMDISKKEAGGLMKKAKSMNDAEGMNMGGMRRPSMPAPGMGGYEMGMAEGGLKPVIKGKNPGLAKLPTEVRNKMGYMADGGMARIKGAPPAQVKGLTYNDNGGKGTF